jgi:3',5'-cyclic AMP phosphodiesterase CpdA
MRKIAHISDLHFGAADPLVAERLAVAIDEIGPDLVVVSGDLTQRARIKQFREARSFLDRLKFPQLIVPGNHDVPLYNVFDRFVNPLENYQRYITPELEPFHSDDEIAVAGINTSRSMTIKGGRISGSQIEALRSRMCAVGDDVLKVVVTHHPFDVPDGEDESSIVGRARRAMPAIASCGADVFLSGHLHVSHISHSARRYKLAGGYSALIVQAGTACSSRGRGEVNSFNVLEFEHTFLAVHRYQCAAAGEGFRLASSEPFTRGERGWARLSVT